MRKYFSFFVVAAFLALPAVSSAAASPNFEVTGWIPYWRTATGTADVLPHLNELTEVNPFVYTIKSDGTFVDNGPLNTEPWTSFIAAAHAQNVRVIPSIMTSNSSLVHTLLSDTVQRNALQDRIVALVNANNFDGIDIDFEGKSADDKDYFSAFLQGLHDRLGNKFLMCTIEARTPIDARYYGTEVPPDADIFANDLPKINQFCDRVRIMTYDQQGIDLQLAAQAESGGQLYAPVADPAWVTKVVNLMAKDIDRSKMLIGVPTYGYEYDVTAYANNQYTYNILWTFNPGYATPIAAQYGIIPSRNAAGELFFSYTPTSSSTAPTAYNNSASVAAAASLYATQYNSHLNFRLMDWPDAQSVQTKIDLARSLGVRGISIFKFDGGEDQNIWNVLNGVKGTTESKVTVTTPTPTTPTPTPTPSTPVAGTLSRGLGIGTVNAQVRILQQILNKDAGTRVSASGVGSSGHETTYFGPATLKAVQKFQIKYGIAKPGNAGYGYVGPATRAKMNSLSA
ncbi:MAG: hypothetical protein JWM46_897 [Candidatus Kaiserbacteria bacterium]|nr:hypothetical protein [Candidatus Kaiserbacteria bacterium]